MEGLRATIGWPGLDARLIGSTVWPIRGADHRKALGATGDLGECSTSSLNRHPLAHSLQPVEE